VHQNTESTVPQEILRKWVAFISVCTVLFLRFRGVECWHRHSHSRGHLSTPRCSVEQFSFRRSSSGTPKCTELSTWPAAIYDSERSTFCYPGS